MGWLENLEKECSELQEQINKLYSVIKSLVQEGAPQKQIDHLQSLFSGFINQVQITSWEIKGWRKLDENEYSEAADWFYKGLNRLYSIPNSQVRIQKEISICLGLGKCHIVTKGYEADEVKKVYQRLFDITDDKVVGKFLALRGLWAHQVMKGQTNESYQTSKELFAIANELEHPLLVIESHMTQAFPLFIMAAWDQAKFHLQKALQVCMQNKNNIPRDFSLENPLLLVLGLTGFSSAYRGYLDKALKQIQFSYEFAKQIMTPYNVALALFFMARIHQIRRDIPKTIHFAARGVKWSKNHGISLWKNISQVILGWALIHNKSKDEGLMLIENSLVALEEFKVTLHKPFLLSILADSYHKIGLHEEACETIENAWNAIEDGNQQIYKIEVLQLKGEILLSDSLKLNEAVNCFHQARKLAINYDMRLFELRSLSSLTKHTPREQSVKLKEELHKLYMSFDEGFETLFLREAKSLID
ncbi:hypothetical protein [Candidatus Uabimicrobium amorphum]|uniref:Adenylate cyclase n=1 Tax=Uabimicrobium amorphum TaxID=2596890 RepID=A0A5S9IIY5_UABAM|nr:hypothetical protein [Candidatus Uabimicrobium amorphum]BBM82574.1 adenylate cyclase [Candidatus Uabimicrobium amorphum]